MKNIVDWVKDWNVWSEITLIQTRFIKLENSVIFGFPQGLGYDSK